ncbi:unnamed protein product [Musa hybrid cultivar]
MQQLASKTYDFALWITFIFDAVLVLYLLVRNIGLRDSPSVNRTVRYLMFTTVVVASATATLGYVPSVCLLSTISIRFAKGEDLIKRFIKSWLKALQIRRLDMEHRCSKHPTHRQAEGVCPYCLTERLSHLLASSSTSTMGASANTSSIGESFTSDFTSAITSVDASSIGKSFASDYSSGVAFVDASSIRRSSISGYLSAIISADDSSTGKSSDFDFVPSKDTKNDKGKEKTYKKKNENDKDDKYKKKDKEEKYKKKKKKMWDCWTKLCGPTTSRTS